MIKAIIFDYDGVIVDSFPIIHKVYLTIFNKLNKKCPQDIENFRTLYGKSSRDMLKKSGMNEEEIDRSNRIYKEEIQKYEQNFYEGIKEVIIELEKEYILFLISSNLLQELKDKMTKLGVVDKFKEIKGGELAPLNKTIEIKAIMKKYNLKGNEIVMIGDRINDYFDAKESGIENVILVEYGWGYDLKLIPEHKQTIKVNKPKEILKAIENLKV